MNAHFGRCPHCRGFVSNGTCTKCGRAVVCSWCNNAIKLFDGTWTSNYLRDESKNDSHGICSVCKRTVLNEILKKDKQNALV